MSAATILLAVALILPRSISVRDTAGPWAAVDTACAESRSPIHPRPGNLAAMLRAQVVSSLPAAVILVFGKHPMD